MIKRIIDRDGAYFPPYGEPTGKAFCRLMSRMAIKPTDALYDVIPESIIPMTIGDNGYTGKIDSYTYDYSLDKYKFHVVDFNEDRYTVSHHCYLFLGMRVFYVDDITDNLLTINATESDDFYGLIRTAEEKGLIAENKPIDGSIWAVNFENQLPEIEYRCEWNTYSLKTNKIRDKEFSKLDIKIRKSRDKSKKTNWRVLPNTTGITTSAGNKKFKLTPLTGIAMTDLPSVYSPRCIEFDIHEDNGGSLGDKLFKLRLFFEIYGIAFNHLSRFKPHSKQVWASQEYENWNVSYYIKDSSNFDREGYYDGEDFGETGQESTYETPKKVFLFRLKPVMEFALYFDESVNYFIQALQYKNFKHTGNSSKLCGNTGANRITITGSDPFTVTDSIGTELQVAMDAGDFKIGDVFKDITNIKYGIITDIDYVADNITVEGGDLGASANVEWAIHESYDRIDKFCSYACACTWSDYSVARRVYKDLKAKSERYMGYYGRDGSLTGGATICKTIKDYSDIMFVPGILNKEILLESTGGDHVRKVVIADVGEAIKFKFDRILAFAGEDSVDNDNSIFMFLKNYAPKKLHINGIDIISHYIESPYLLGIALPSDIRKIWMEEDTSNIYFGITAAGDTTLSDEINSTVTTIPVVSTTGFPSEGDIYIDGEKIHYTSKDTINLYGATRGVINRKHDNAEPVYLVHNLLLRPVLLGSLTVDLTIDEITTLQVTKSEYFTLPDNKPYDGSDTGFIVVNDEIIEVDWSNYSEEYIFTLPSNPRGKRGTEAKDHSVNTPVYIFDYLLAGDLIRPSGYNVDYSDDYKARITLNRVGRNEPDAANSLRVYIVRTRWNL